MVKLKMVKETVMVLISGLMETSTKATGQTIKHTDKVNSTFILEHSTMEIGSEIRHKGTAYIRIQMDINIKVIGQKISKMEKEKKLYKMDLAMLASLKMD